MEKKSAWAKTMSLKEQFTVLKRLLPFAIEFKWQFITAIAFAAILSVVNILLPKLLQYYMDHFLTNKNATLNIMLFFAGLYFLGTIIKAFTQFVQNFCYSMGSERTLELIRTKLFAKLHRLGMHYFDQVPAGSIVSRVTNDTKTLFDFWMLFLTLIVTFFSSVSAFIAMYFTNMKLALIILLFLPIVIVVIIYYQLYSSKIYRQMREYLSEINAKLSENLLGMSIIQQFRQENRILREFEETNGDYLKMRLAMIKVNSLLLNPVITLLFILSEVIALGVFGISGTTSFVQAGVIYAFLSYLQSFFNPMSDVMNSLTVFQDGMVAGSRILRIMDDQTLAPVQDENSDSQITKGRIEFKNVTFAYERGKDVLKDISFTVESGQTIALVGHTGSGKSSTINILMRFYEFAKGKVEIDGTDIREFSTKELRRKIGLVLQDSFLFYGDIASNIRMFDQNVSDAQIKKAAEFVHADQFIEKLPKKYHAKVIERGATYSAGEKQLLSFARTIVRNPKILILDEATANIDTQTELLIQEGLKQMRAGRTTIVIAHRLSTIRDADQILVLDDGRITERGTHDELLAKHGKYYEMYQLQTTQKLLND
ncbi:ABC transporter ATP-binding protein [Liquorilactobacillus mali]|uniref:ABC transporter n=1 Tax=Liquorilactobacillus mali KCTC 3596 = DSM 20444 TaxID=1046596 RepID=J0L328_9LACO|nr:ABC transporter ATP-binding protein [Liquorilactobacillus mali]EJE97336.1 ABC transporter [Liquorilactobacillus mali KCTC 3596 = DSM 20444]KRN11379.1 ABC transporter [Liquorilactobacillus mali KCTC 3596 = DSM 20444]MDC7953115.1 ABC transporter ATP-binding protein [Liquorilactobacillus mali]MDV7757291.1 ATP-binding cassette domain-containing protein [Liquorilactobacillus mali]QFQ75286.1 ABC transporter ATP-binding protein [Liquorilactobacillus mali]